MDDVMDLFDDMSLDDLGLDEKSLESLFQEQSKERESMDDSASDLGNQDNFDYRYEKGYMRLTAMSVVKAPKNILATAIAINPDTHFELFLEDLIRFERHINIKARQLEQEGKLTNAQCDLMFELVTKFSENLQYLKDHVVELTISKSFIQSNKSGRDTVLSEDQLLTFDAYKHFVNISTIYQTDNYSLTDLDNTLSIYKRLNYSLRLNTTLREIQKALSTNTDTEYMQSNFSDADLELYRELRTLNTINFTYTQDELYVLEQLDFPTPVAGNEAFYSKDLMAVLDNPIAVNSQNICKEFDQQVAELTNKRAQLKVSLADKTYYGLYF